MTDKPRTDAHPQSSALQRLNLTFDAKEFAHFLDGCDWTDDQKIEFIEELWKIILSFVDLGFDIHPVQEVFSELEVDSVDVLGINNNCETFITNETGPTSIFGSGRQDS